MIILVLGLGFSSLLKSTTAYTNLPISIIIHRHSVLCRPFPVVLSLDLLQNNPPGAACGGLARWTIFNNHALLVGILFRSYLLPLNLSTESMVRGVMITSRCCIPCFTTGLRKKNLSRIVMWIISISIVHVDMHSKNLLLTFYAYNFA